MNRPMLIPDGVLTHVDYTCKRRYTADVVVVGTGAGGAAAGAELAEAGHDVLFVEEGSYIPQSSFNPHLEHSMPRLYRDTGTTMIFGNPTIPYVEGRAVGGSTTINGGMCWRPPTRVMDDWARETGDTSLGAEGMDWYFSRVEERINAKPQPSYSIGPDNRVMSRGARKLGWEYRENHRNQDQCVGTNNCGFGCPTGAKQSTLLSYMPRAMGAGAQCLTEIRVERLLIEGGRCVGVAGRTYDPRTRRPSHEVEVRGRAVVIACGAIQTPYLLLRHRVARRSRQLGKNLLLHPNVKITGLFPFDIGGWAGVSQGGQVREFHEEGIVLAENFIPPGAMGTHLPHHGSRAWELMTRYKQMVVGGALVEDSTSGRVLRGPFGMPLPWYQVTKGDHARFKKGARLLSELFFSVGADAVLLPFSNAHLARSMAEVDRILLGQTRRKWLELFTVHLMGTARMGAREDRSVIDLDGCIWDLPGCYVADASVFPTAIGVNPQVTIMAMATRIGLRLAETLQGEHRAAVA